jgi:hypothetical protein
MTALTTVKLTTLLRPACNAKRIKLKHSNFFIYVCLIYTISVKQYAIS